MVRKTKRRPEALFFYLSGDVRANYKAKFITGWSWNEDDPDFNKFCSWIFKENTRAVETDEMIRSAIKARSEYQDLLSSVVGVCSLYEKSGFNEDAKYRMTRKASTIDKRLADFILIKETRLFTDLKYKIVDYVKNCKSLKSLGSQEGGSYTRKVIFYRKQTHYRPVTSAAAFGSVRS